MSAVVPAELSALHTLVDLLNWRVQASPQGLAYREFDVPAQAWRDWSWGDIGSRVQVWSRAVAASGVRHGDTVAILLPNGLNAISVDLAVMSNGAVPVPLHAIDNPASVAYILSDSAVSMLVVQSRAQWLAIADVGTPLPNLQTVVVTDEVAAPMGAASSPAIWGLDAWLAREPVVRPTVQLPVASDLATIVYTSGTTGKPKGVMLSHGNVLSNVKAVAGSIDVRSDDVFLSFLPLSHTFERTAGYYLPMAAGASVAYARSVALLADDLRHIRPTVLVSVPRIYERVQAAVQAQLAESPFKAKLFGWAESVGWRRFCRAQQLAVPPGPPAFVDALAWPVLDRLVASVLRSRFGGRLRAAVSGGAPLSPSVARTFLGLGIPLLQGYGMTETSPVVAVNLPHDNDPATVGKPLPGVEVRIGPDKELQVRGPTVMQGYLNRPEDTARILSADGWLGTGDQAAIEQGRVRILGRIKEIIVTSTGEKVPPADLELAITGDPLFAQAFVLGEQRQFIAAIAVVSPGEWRRLATELHKLARDVRACHRDHLDRQRKLAEHVDPLGLIGDADELLGQIGHDFLSREGCPTTFDHVALVVDPVVRAARVHLERVAGDASDGLGRAQAAIGPSADPGPKAISPQ